MAVPVRPWYTGSATIKTPSMGALSVLGTKSQEITENIDKIDTTNTGSTKITAPDTTTVIVQKTSIQAGAELEINISGQYGAGSAGDPPQFGSTNLYGNQKLIAGVGDTISDNAGGATGLNMLVDAYTVRYQEGTGNAIEYQIRGHSNGGYNRTVATS